MADAIDRIRDRAETDLGKLLDGLSSKHARSVRRAIERYGSVSAIPEEFWESLRADIEGEAAAILLLLLTMGYQTQARRINRRGASSLLADSDSLRGAAAGTARSMGRGVADDYVDRARNRLRSAIDDAADELNGEPAAAARKRVNDAIDDVFHRGASAPVSVTNVTRALTTAQNSAGDDIGRSAGVTVTSIWVTERDSKVCPVCRPLDGKTVDEWEATLAGAFAPSESRRAILEQLGPPAHPNCRCTLRHVVDMPARN